MPTRKQRRRRQKDRRHEYEYVYVDDEGRELDPEEVATVASPNGKTKATRAAQGGRGRRVRTPDPPTWRRVIKRALIFAPFMFLLIMLLSPELTTVQQIQQTAFLMMIFMPFSYLMDTITYRMLRKRQAKLEGEVASGKR
jgi:hypothetical protein